MTNELLVQFIDNDAVHLKTMVDWLGGSEFASLSAEDGLTGLRQFFASHPDIVVVDTDVTELSGWQVIERIREITNTPVIITSSEASRESLRKGFDLGVEGFLVKPVSKKDLLTRLTVIRDRNFGGNGNRRWLYQSNGLTIDWRSCEVYANGAPVSLTGTEFRLLAYLVERRGWVLSHEQILSHVWGSGYAGDRDQVKLYIWYLRRKIESDPKNPKLLVTRRGLGYMFVG